MIRLVALTCLLVATLAQGRPTEVAVRDRYVDDAGVKIHYVVRGHGQLVVLIHGFPDFWYGWRDQIAALSRTYQVAALDLRGYNLSDKPAGVEQYDMTHLVSDVAAVIHDLGRDGAVIVGHDWGGGIAWAFAIAHPEMTERLVVLQTPHPRGLLRELRTNPAQEAASAYARFFQQDGAATGLTPEVLTNFATTNAEVRPRYLEAFARSDPEAMLNYYKANYPRAPYDDVVLPAVQAPVLVMHGVSDPFLLAACHNGTWQWVDASVTLVMVPGASHFLQQEASPLVTYTITRWLQDQRHNAKPAKPPASRR